MRIIGGKHKGKKLHPPKSLPVRPTTDFAKEGLFNVLRNRINIEGLAILDLCAGTGNMTFEFASRGAQSILAVDLSFACVKYIKQQAAELGYENIRSVKSDIFGFVKKVNGQYDLIFADPPYALEGVKQLPDLLLEKSILNKDGFLILEHGKQHKFEEHQQFLFSKTYGNVNFTFFEPIAP